LRAGGGLEKEVDLGAPAQRRALFFDLPRNLHRFVREIEQRFDLEPVEALDAEEVAAGESGGGGH